MVITACWAKPRCSNLFWVQSCYINADACRFLHSHLEYTFRPLNIYSNLSYPENVNSYGWWVTARIFQRSGNFLSILLLVFRSIRSKPRWIKPRSRRVWSASHTRNSTAYIWLQLRCLQCNNYCVMLVYMVFMWYIQSGQAEKCPPCIHIIYI